VASSRTRIIDVVQRWGWRAAIRASFLYAPKLVRLWWWDRVHNVSTRHKAPLESLGLEGPSATHAAPYEASDSTLLPRLLRTLDLDYPRFAFIDLGCGKGQAVLMATEFPFEQVLGVELSPRLADMARANCATFRSARQRCHDVRIICGDATDCSFPRTPLLIYLFNPFGEVVVRAVVANLARSLVEQPREVVVIYHNPNHAHVIDGSGAFELISSGRDEWDHRKLRYQVFRAKTPIDSQSTHQDRAFVSVPS
jgi:SAM-dependent methyltransferase